MSRLIEDIRKSRNPELQWLELSFGRELDHKHVQQLVGTLIASNYLRRLVFEIQRRGNQLTYRLGTADQRAVTSMVTQASADITVRRTTRAVPQAGLVLRVTANPWDRMLTTDQPEATTARILGALALAASTGDGDEDVIHQIVVARRTAPRAPKKEVLEVQGLTGLERAVRTFTTGATPLPAERLEARTQKQSTLGAMITWRIISSKPKASKAIKAYSAAVWSLESPGLRLRLKREQPRRAIEARPAPTTMLLSAAELSVITAWPFGDQSYPGYDRRGATTLPANKSARRDERVVAISDHPATEGQLVGLSAADGLQHLHALGPTGVGKSTLLLNMILADMKAGRSAVVLDPKGDLVDDVLASAPASEIDRIVVLDPARTDYLVGFNPLKTSPSKREQAVDGLLHIFTQLHGSNFGPRSADIVGSALMTLAGSDHPTLCLMPQLLIDARLRRVIIKQSGLSTDASLKMFWGWYEGLSDAERNTVIAPVNNKLRPLLIRSSLRGMLAQTDPDFDLGDVFAKRTVLLVPLRKGQIGPQAAQLVGSMLVSTLWQHALGRSGIERGKRHPVTLYLDEFQEYLHLPTDMSDVLAQARALGLGLVLSNQHLDQLGTSVRSAVMANTRSKAIFSIGASDARVLAAEAPDLKPIDFQELDRYQVYLRTMDDGQAQPWVSGRTLPPPRPLRSAERLAARLAKRHGRDPREVDEELLKPITDRPDESEAPVGRRAKQKPGGSS